ncbi:MAG: response regulator transcription factor [Rhodothermales bacterium]
MSLSCMIVDDEPLARRVLENFLTHLDDCELVASCASAREALSVLSERPVDLLFLDIQMPGLSGLDLIPLLPEPPAVVFTTAHREYAVEGFELQAVDYLLKPVSMARFKKAVDRVRALHATRNASSVARITVRVDRQNVHVRTGDIVYIEAMKDYARIHTLSGLLVTKRALSSLEEELSGAGFIRIHHSFLVRGAAVEAHAPEFVLVAGKRLPVGRAYRQEALARLELA